MHNFLFVEAKFIAGGGKKTLEIVRFFLGRAVLAIIYISPGTNCILSGIRKVFFMLLCRKLRLGAEQIILTIKLLCILFPQQLFLFEQTKRISFLVCFCLDQVG